MLYLLDQPQHYTGRLAPGKVIDKRKEELTDTTSIQATRVSKTDLYSSSDQLQLQDMTPFPTIHRFDQDYSIVEECTFSFAIFAAISCLFTQCKVLNVRQSRSIATEKNVKINWAVRKKGKGRRVMEGHGLDKQIQKISWPRPTFLSPQFPLSAAGIRYSSEEHCIRQHIHI